MKRVIKSKLLRKALILSFLVMALVFVVSSGKQPQTAYAAPCCRTCLPDYDLCMASCGENSICQQNCWNSLDFCNRHCYSCGQAGGGEACTENWECVSGSCLEDGTCDWGP